MLQKLHELYAIDSKYRTVINFALCGSTFFAVEEAMRGNWTNSLVASCFLLGSALLTRTHVNNYPAIDYQKRMENCEQVAKNIEALLPKEEKPKMSFNDYKKSLEKEIHNI